jgi:hypothetical protein
VRPWPLSPAPILYDPHGWLAPEHGGTLAGLVIVVGGGEASIAALRATRPELPAVAVSGRRPLSAADAQRIAAALRPWPESEGGAVWLWPALDVTAAASAARALRRANVAIVLLIAERQGPLATLEPLGHQRAVRRLSAILDGAGMDGGYDPDDPFESRAQRSAPFPKVETSPLTAQFHERIAA